MGDINKNKSDHQVSWEELTKHISHQIHKCPPIPELLYQSSLILNATELKGMLCTRLQFSSEDRRLFDTEPEVLAEILDDLEKISSWIFTSISLIGFEDIYFWL